MISHVKHGNLRPLVSLEGPVEQKLRPPRKGCHLAVLVSLRLEEGLVGPGPRPEVGMLVGAGV